MEKILLAFVAKTLNRSADEVTALLKTEEGKPEPTVDVLVDLDKARIKEIKTKSRQDGFDEAKADAFAKFEKDLKGKFDLANSDKRGLELIEELVALKAANPGEVSLAAVKLHPAYLELETNQQKALDKQAAKLQKEFQAKEATWQKAEVFRDVESTGMRLFEEMNPILSSDAKKAENQRNILRNELKGYDYQKEGDKVIIIGPDGKRLENEHGYPVELKDFVRDKASSYFDFKATPDRTGAANGTGTTPARTQHKKMTEEEYTSKFDAAKTREERQSLVEAWKEQNKPAEG